ncbi:MAG: hypothetical protein HYV07_14480 [Deltaproteobacteria bacterium]|nr:hypothetical protein [Deltaproteobacteria bacterium]
MGSRAITSCFALTLACAEPAELRCADASTLDSCSGGECEHRICRPDQVCEDAACVALEAAHLGIDFTVASGRGPRDRTFVADLSKIPPRFVEALRFDLGDGDAGWGRMITHRFRRDGVFPVGLEVRVRWPHDPTGTTILSATQLVVVGDEPPDRPFFFTIDRISETLNGSTPFRSNAYTPADPGDDFDTEFHLVVPRSGFSLDLVLLDHPRRAVDRTTMTLVADRELGNGLVPAGTNLATRLAFEAADSERAPKGQWLVPPELAFPPGLTKLTFSAQSGGSLFESQLAIETLERTPELLPFLPPMEWLFRYDLDYFTDSSRETDNGHLVLEVVPGADGKPDFLEELRLVGCASDDSAAGAASVHGRGRVGASAIFARWVHDELVRAIDRIWLGAPMRIWSTGDSGAPDPLAFDPKSGFSIMRLGGKLPEGLGRAYFSPYNSERVDNSEPHLGVGTASLLQLLVGADGLDEPFRAVRPGLGVPIGEHELDAIVLSDEFDPFDPSTPEVERARFEQLSTIARWLGLVFASVTAHEMGHSMGLMPNGPPPDGFFGGRADVSFMGPATDSHHADLPGLNLMQAGGNIVSVAGASLEGIELSEDTDLSTIVDVFMRELRLSEYAREYALGRLTYRRF